MKLCRLGPKEENQSKLIDAKVKHEPELQGTVATFLIDSPVDQHKLAWDINVVSKEFS